MKPAAVLRLAAIIDILFAMVLLATPFLRSRVGLPITLVVCGAIAFGSVVLLVLAGRLDR